MGKLVSMIVVAAGLAGGIATGLWLRPPPVPCEMTSDPDCAEEAKKKDAAAQERRHADTPPEFVELNRQFVVPLLREGRVAALVITSLAAEVDAGMSEAVHTLEPKLRDAFLQVLFVHAHSGGFDGDFTAQRSLEDLKARLMEQAEGIVGPGLRNVLVTEIVRQDL